MQEIVPVDFRRAFCPLEGGGGGGGGGRHTGTRLTRCIWLSCAAVKALHCSSMLIISSARIASRTNNNNINDYDSDCHIHNIIIL